MGSSRDNEVMDDYQDAKLAKFCLDHASVCAFRLDQDGFIRYVNQEACDSLGYSQAEFLKLSVFDIDPNINRDMWPGHWQQLCDDGSLAFESQFRRKDGMLFPIEVNATLVEFEGHRYSMALIKDITERNRIYESLCITQFVFDKAPFGIFLTRDSGIITNVNEYACQYLGYTKEEFLGMHVFEIDRCYTEPEIEQLWLREQRDGIVTFESVHQRKDGTDIPVEIIQMLLALNNELYSASFVKDITERKEAEKQREKMEAQLLQAQKMEAIGTLAGGIAHDFNNILTSIFGFSQLAQSNLDRPEKADDYIDQVLKGAQKATELVQQILTFSRKSTHKKQPLAISIVIKEALKLLRASIPATIEIKQTIDATATVMADPTKIHQVIMNLCTNAYHAMLRTGGTLAVGLKEVEFSRQDCVPELNIQPGRYLKLEVSDTGIGMTATTMEKMFEPYFTTKTSDKGTGLGLAVVFGIVKEHNGHIKVYSEPGQGSTFHVYFPIIEKSPDPYVLKKEEDAPQIGSETILFVDDEESVCTVVQALLQELGYTVNIFSSGGQALEAYQKNPSQYDLVITDMTMPGITGMQLVQKILALQPEQPVVLCTGHSELTNREKALASGISAYYEKPVIIKAFSKVIRTVLDEAKT
jgi:PAS domain S-box-containing protein